MSGILVSRRRALTLGATGAAGLILSGCDSITRAPATRNFLKIGQRLSLAAQRALLAGQPLAREFSAADMSPVFRVNGSAEARSDEYRALVDNNFENYRLVVDGLVARPLSLSMADIRAIPSRTQITRHDCVEGWSAIGQWSGAPLHTVLERAGLAANARFVVFHCFDTLSNGRGAQTPYYESIDLLDAFHPQTILAYGMNGAPLSIGHGAPLRLRVERQLGYKQAKFIRSITITDRVDNLFGGNGGYWEDIAGYEWYGGI